MAKAKEEEVSFADQILSALRVEAAKKQQNNARAKAEAAGYNRDILRLYEMLKAKREGQNAVNRLVQDQARSVFSDDAQLQGGLGTALMTNQGTMPPKAPGRGIMSVPTVEGEPMPRQPRAPIDTTAEPLRHLRGPAPTPAPTPAGGANPGMLMRLLGRAAPILGAAGAMAPTEVAPGTYRPNEEAFQGRLGPERPVQLPPIEVRPDYPASRKVARGPTPVLPERKPPVPVEEEKPLPPLDGYRYVNMVVPVPAQADEKQVAGFAEYIGAKDWGFRDDYVGEMYNHPAEKR